MRNTSLSVLPIPENAFFEQAVFNQDLSQGLLELARLSLELLDLVRGRLTRRVAGEPFLARLQELLRPTVVQVLIDPFLAAELSNAVLATQAFQHDTDLLFSGMMPACGSANIPECLFSALRYALARLSHRCRSAGYDEPAILSYAISSFCPTSADGLHGQACYRIVQDCVDLEELLLAAGTLAPGDRDDHGKVEAALSRFLSLCIA